MLSVLALIPLLGFLGFGLLWLTVVGIGVARGWIQRRVEVVVETCGIYWLYVCGLWVVLFALVYN